GKLAADNVVEAEAPAEADQRLVAAIVDDDEADREAELRRRPQALDRVHRRAVPQPSDDLPAPPAAARAHRRRQPMAETAAGAGVEGVALEDRQKVVHCPPRRRRLLDDDAAPRPQGSKTRTYKRVDQTRGQQR